MNFLIILLLSPAAICAQRYRKSTNPNDEPFLPINPDYPYNPKLMKRGAEQAALQPQVPLPQQSQALTQLTPELYAPKVDARDSYSASYGQSPYGSSPYGQTPYYPSALASSYDPYSKASSTAQNALASSPYYQSSYSSYNTNPYGLLGAYGSPYGVPGASNYGASGAANYAAPGAANYGATPPSNFGASPYATGSGPPPYYYYPPYYYPNYYGQPPYPPPPAGYPGAPSKHHNDEDDDYEDEKRREKSKKTGKNRLRNSDRDSNTEYVDGANYIISSSKDLDGESSSHRSPSPYNQIEQDSDVQPRNVVPKATYRLVSISGPPPTADYNAGPSGYIKVQQLEQLMRQALARLLAQNAAQQANLQQIQQEVTQQQMSKDNQHQYISIPNTIAKTGLSYVVNPNIINRANPGQYNPSQLLQPVNKQSAYVQKAATSVTLQQSPGIYIPPHKNGNEHSAPPEYGDYDAPESITPRSHATAEPTRASYPYSTYRPTQQTNLEDVNFGNKHKTKS